MQEVYFKFDLVKNDADDNKFVDLFIASNSDILVTNDKHLLNIATTKFPYLNIFTLEEYSNFMKVNK
jgi:uncharacterized protein